MFSNDIATRHSEGLRTLVLTRFTKLILIWKKFPIINLYEYRKSD